MGLDFKSIQIKSFGSKSFDIRRRWREEVEEGGVA